MIFFSSFLILFYYLRSCQSWIIGSLNSDLPNFFQNNQEFKSVIKNLKWNQGLYSHTGFFIRRFIEKAELLNEFYTLIKYCHYKDLIEKFGNILFAKEMTEYGIEIIHFEKLVKFFRISWLNSDKTDSIHLIIQKLFEKHFPFIANDGIIYIFSPIFKRIREDSEKNVEIKNKLKIFRNQENLLQVYDRRNANFDGIVILICSLDPSSDSTLKSEILESSMKNIKDIISKKQSRFGAYTSGKDSKLNTFAFLQYEATDSDRFDIKKESWFTNRGLRIIDLSSRNKSKCWIKFLDFITDMAFYNCR